MPVYIDLKRIAKLPENAYYGHNAQFKEIESDHLHGPGRGKVSKFQTLEKGKTWRLRKKITLEGMV